MRVSVRVAAGEPYMPASLGNYIGHSLPLRIGEIAVPTTIVAIEPIADGGYVLELELPDADLRFEAWFQRTIAG